MYACVPSCALCIDLKLIKIKQFKCSNGSVAMCSEIQANHVCEAPTSDQAVNPFPGADAALKATGNSEIGDFCLQCVQNNWELQLGKAIKMFIQLGIRTLEHGPHSRDPHFRAEYHRRHDLFLVVLNAA